MDNIDPDKLREVIEGNALYAIYQSHGDAGTRNFRELSLVIKRVFHFVEPESLQGALVVFKCLDDSARPFPEHDAIIIVEPAALTGKVSGNIVIQALSDGRLLLWRNPVVDFRLLTIAAVVYRYDSRREQFLTQKGATDLVKVGTYTSVYSVPAFSDIRVALEHYRTQMASQSSCQILRDVWSDVNRLFFRSGPESIMRNSLLQFLKTTIRDADVRPEQNMDESHPVDVKASFNFSKRIAVVEIKWVGDSVHGTGKVSVRYRDSRANDGARQLAEYLDMNKQQAPNHLTRGYLVVFDGRRHGLKEGQSTISHADGGHYRQQDINFDPKYNEVRDDFDPPLRMFMEPICSP
jgi:hypothetical protein